VKTVADYEVIPTRIVPTIALIVTCCEAFLAVAFLLGEWTDLAAAVAALLLLVFATVIVVTLRRNRRILCGCFGQDEEVTTGSLARVGVLFLCVVILEANAVDGSTRVAGVASVFDRTGSIVDLLLQAAIGAGFLVAFRWASMTSEVWSMVRGTLGSAAASRGGLTR